MTKARLLFPLVLCLFIGTLSAQDVHFTLHNMNPVWLNPARTGAFLGTARIGGTYRGQWHSLSGINTPSIFADAPIVRGFRENDWVGVGFNFIQDNARQEFATDGGLSKVQTTIAGLSASYHLSLDDNRRNVITLGATYGRNSIALDLTGQPLTEEQIASGLGGGGLSGTALENLMADGDSKGYTDISAGLMLRSVLDPARGNALELGVALIHLNAPMRESIIPRGTGGGGPNPTPNPPATGNQDDRKRLSTIHAHASLDYGLTDDWRFLPTVFFQNSANNSSVSLQAWAGRILKPDVMLKFGLGYRTADAGKVLFGLDYKDIQAAISYDVTLSQQREINNYQGAFELSAIYTIKIYKQPEVTPSLLCPRF
ncbi:MAG: type IX secretion system membrane protein PorP/SprF [Saprospiraceae bacterium]